MAMAEYWESVAEEMRRKSEAIRQGFSEHRPSAGANRENLVEKFLKEHLPKRFGVSTGLIFSHDGMFSNQADLVVVDDQNNAPLYPENRNKLWPVEAVYALIEVKTNLSPSDLADAIGKGRKFKRLQRKFCEAGWPLRIKDSLFVIWSFRAPRDLQKLKGNLLNALSGVPPAEQPDFVVVPDRLMATSGSFLELSVLGHPGSQRRQQLQAQHGSDLSALLPKPVGVYDLGKNSLLAWYVWFDSWLRQAGTRFTNPADYLPPDKVFGVEV